jgi:hypothetical protein
MTRFCAGEDSWLARRSNHPEDPGTSEARDGNGKPRRNKNNKRRHSGNGGEADDTAVNAGFSGSKSGPRKKPSKGNRDGPSALDKILDRPCQIHGTSDKPTNHTNRNCWVIKQAGKITAEEQGKGPRSEDDDEPRGPSNGGQKQFPSEVKTVNMIYVMHIPKKEHKRALRDVYAVEPVAPKFNPWSACPITFDRRDHPTSIRHGGTAALVLDPIVDGFHLTRVLMDGGSSLNLIYSDTVRKMGIDPSRIKPSNTTFKGVIPGIEARCSGSITLEVVFGSPDNFRSEDLIFDIVPFRSGYHALLGRTAFARFNAVPHYAYLKLKMPGPKGVITINGNTERSLRTEEHTAALAAEVQAAEEASQAQSVAKTLDARKCAQAIDSVPQHSHPK